MPIIDDPNSPIGKTIPLVPADIQRLRKGAPDNFVADKAYNLDPQFRSLADHYFQPEVNSQLDDQTRAKLPSMLLNMHYFGTPTMETPDDLSAEIITPPQQTANPFNPFSQEKQGSTFADRLRAARPKEGSLGASLVENARAPGSAAAGTIIKAIGNVTGMDVSQNPDVQNLPRNIERSGNVARVALPVAAGIATSGLSLPATAAVSGLAGATGQLTEDITDFATGEQAKTPLGIAGSAVGAGVLDAALDVATLGGYRLAKAGLARKSFDDIVSEGIMKGVSPQFRGAMRNSPTELLAYKKKAGDAVADLITNKQAFEYIDDAGDVVSQGHVPTNLAEFAQAIQQRKKQIFNQYSALSKKATEQGEMISLRDIADKLIAYADSPVKNIADSGKTAYAKTQAAKLLQYGDLTPSQVEELITELNQGLAKAFDNKAFKGISEVDGSIAQALRDSLDDTVLNATGGNYQELKNAYGALKSIEKDVGHRALIVARKSNKGILDMTDIFTGGDLVQGALTGNPAQVARGIFGRALKEYYKLLNSPDANIMRMFSRGEKVLSSLPVSSVDDLPLSSFSPQGVKDAAKMDELVKGGMTPKQAAKSLNDFPDMTPDEIVRLTPEEKATGLIGGSDSVVSGTDVGSFYGSQGQAKGYVALHEKNIASIQEQLSKNPVNSKQLKASLNYEKNALERAKIEAAKFTDSPIPSVGGGLEPLMKEARKYKSAEEFLRAMRTQKLSESSKELVAAAKSIKPDKNGVVQFTKELTDLWHKATGTPLPKQLPKGNPTPIEGTSLFVEDLPF